MRIKENRYHFVSDSYFAFMLEGSAAVQFEFSNIRAIAWAALGGFFKTELVHAVIVFSGREKIHFWISEEGLHALAEGGISLPQVAPNIGMQWEKSYKSRIKNEGKAWKKDLLNRLNSPISWDVYKTSVKEV
tara:strand:+ start:358 stop:753 length:396 start_codon:yes stop_codon:yes gene_type:complete